MSKTFLRGLALLELIDRMGPVTITELARHSNADKAFVSRTVSACVADGWVTRQGRQVVLGPRAALLGNGGPVDRALREAEPLVHAIAGVTGLLTQIAGLVGSTMVVFASATGRGPSVDPGLPARSPVWATAAGRAIAAQLDDATLDAILPPDPLPDLATTLAEFAPAMVEQYLQALQVRRPDGAGHPPLPRDRSELQKELDAIRREGIAFDRGSISPDISCVAVPWSRPSVVGAIVCVGSPVQLSGKEPLVAGTLKAAAAPGAAPEDIVTAAAQVIAAGRAAAG